MSTDRSRLVSSIRRIVLTDPDLSSALDAWQNRGDQASSAGTGTSDAERDRLCCDGSASDNPNPGADTRDTSEGGQDGLDADDPADIGDMGGGCLSGVTDCATGDPVCFCGNDWVPPEGWDGPTDPPVLDYYEDGFYWQIMEDNDYTALAPILACLEYEEEVACPSCEGYDYRVNEIDSTSVSCIREKDEITQSFATANKEDCSVDPDPSCDDPVPTEDAWPSDGCTNLAIKNGTIVGSKYDPENDGTYSKPMSEIELCDGSGNSFFLSPASNGGWKTIDSTKTDGYLYDSQGNKIAHIDGNEYSDPDV